MEKTERFFKGRFDLFKVTLSVKGRGKSKYTPLVNQTVVGTSATVQAYRENQLEPAYKEPGREISTSQSRLKSYRGKNIDVIAAPLDRLAT
jgi:hypothetical protein